MIEINQMLKENFQQQLNSGVSLPEDLASNYKQWIQSLMRVATQRLNQQQAPAAQPTGEGTTNAQ